MTVFASCSKSDSHTPEPTVYPEENPLALYLKNSEFDQKTNLFINQHPAFEIGFSFKPRVKGKINAITLQVPTIPDDETNIRVTIWNVATKTPLRTLIIPNVVAKTEMKQTIDPLDMNSETEYLISFMSTNYYLRSKTDMSAAAYPIEAGNIVITKCRSINITNPLAQDFPQEEHLNFYPGDISFVFQQTE
jgi:hypothetical protein